MHLLGFLAQFWWAVLLVILVAVGTFVMVAGRNAPGGLAGRTREGWRKWKQVGEKVANVQARVFLTVFYFTLMAPFGLWQATVSDRLRLRRRDVSSFWIDRSTLDRDMATARRQF